MANPARLIALACAAAFVPAAFASSTAPAHADARDAGPVVVATFAGGANAGDADGSLLDARLRSPTGLALAPDGSLYVIDPVAGVLRIVTADHAALRTAAGKPGVDGYHDGAAADAAFLHPQGVAVGRDGAVYVADTGNFAIRKLVHGVVTTLAGGHAGKADGSGTAAQFAMPLAVAVDRSNDVYVADYGVGVRKIARDGTVTTLASLGTRHVTGVSCAGEILWVASASGLARYHTTGTNALITTVRGAQTMQIRFYDGYPYGVAALNDTQIAFTDAQTQTVRYFEVDRPARVLAGTAQWNAPQFSGGFADGDGFQARFFTPAGIAFRPDGTLLVADAGNHRIRSVSRWDRRTFVNNDGSNLDQYTPGPDDDGIAWISSSQAWFDTTFDESIEGVAQAELARSPLYAGTRRHPKIIPIALNGAEVDALVSIVKTYFSGGYAKAVVWQVNCTFGMDARLFRATLHDLDATLRPSHVAFIAVLQPTSTLDFPNESPIWNVDTDTPSYYGRGPSACHDQFLEVLKSSNVPFEDAYPDFAAVENGTGGPLFNTYDQHLNSRGRALMGHVGARTLQKYLKAVR